MAKPIFPEMGMVINPNMTWLKRIAKTRTAICAKIVPERGDERWLPQSEAAQKWHREVKIWQKGAEKGRGRNQYGGKHY